MRPIISIVAKRLPYVGSFISGIGLAFNIQKILESATPMGAAKIIAGRFSNEWTPPELLVGR